MHYRLHLLIQRACTCRRRRRVYYSYNYSQIGYLCLVTEETDPQPREPAHLHEELVERVLRLALASNIPAPLFIPTCLSRQCFLLQSSCLQITTPSRTLPLPNCNQPSHFLLFSALIEVNDLVEPLCFLGPHPLLPLLHRMSRIQLHFHQEIFIFRGWSPHLAPVNVAAEAMDKGSFRIIVSGCHGFLMDLDLKLYT